MMLAPTSSPIKQTCTKLSKQQVETILKTGNLAARLNRTALRQPCDKPQPEMTNPRHNETNYPNTDHQATVELEPSTATKPIYTQSVYTEPTLNKLRSRKLKRRYELFHDSDSDTDSDQPEVHIDEGNAIDMTSLSDAELLSMKGFHHDYVSTFISR